MCLCNMPLPMARWLGDPGSQPIKSNSLKQWDGPQNCGRAWFHCCCCFLPYFWHLPTVRQRLAEYIKHCFYWNKGNQLYSHMGIFHNRANHVIVSSIFTPQMFLIWEGKNENVVIDQRPKTDETNAFSVCIPSCALKFLRLWFCSKYIRTWFSIDKRSVMCFISKWMFGDACIVCEWSTCKAY